MIDTEIVKELLKWNRCRALIGVVTRSHNLLEKEKNQTRYSQQKESLTQSI